MIELIIQNDDNWLSSGYKNLIKILMNSGLFYVKRQELFKIPKRYHRKEEGLSELIINGVKILLDANGGYFNIENIYNDGLFTSVYKDVKTIVKIQYKPHKFWDYFTEKTNIKVLPWIMWPTSTFKMSNFKWENKNHKYIASCAGGKNSNRRWGRPPFIKWCINKGGFHSRRCSVDEYIKVLQQCKWALILQGGNIKNCDGKNTREYECVSCYMPLALNYIPNYPKEYPFIPDVHYLYIKKPEDLEKLIIEDPMKYAKHSENLWNNYLKPRSAAEFLLRLISS